MLTDGQLLIGTTTATPGGTHIRVGLLNAASAGISANYNSMTGNIDLAVGAVAPVTFQTQSGTAQASGNILNVVGAAGVTTSATGSTITIMGGGAGASLSLIPQTGTNPVVPNGGNQIAISGAVVAAGTNPIQTNGGTNLLKIEVQKSQALNASDATKIGLCNFYAPQFQVDANGFVQLAGSVNPPILAINVNASTAPGTNPVLSSGGAITITGGQVASGVVGANVIRTDSLAANTFTIEIQRATSAAVATLADNGVSHYDSGKFTVDANGFVTLASSVFGTITGNDAVALSQTAGNWNIVGTGSITTSGAVSTLTIALQGLTNHALLVGAGTATITKVAATATTGQVLQNNAGADPSYSTATYPSTTTINQILYSSSTNVVAGLATANQGVLTTGATGTPVITPLAVNGQLIIGSTAGVPAAATLTQGTGISITNSSNGITIAVNGSVVAQTLTGQSGGAISPSAGNWNISGATVAAGTSPLVTSGAGSTLTINAQRSQAIAAADSTKVGLSNFNSAQFTVDANGFVGLKGSTTNPGILGIHPNAISGTGTDPTVADASGNVSILGLSVAAGTNPVRTVATSGNSITTLVQTSQALSASDATKIGLCNFDSSVFSVDSNGFVTSAAGGTGLLVASGILTNSQIKNLHATPIQMIAAPGVGKVISIETAMTRLNYGGHNPFTGGGLAVSAYYGTAFQASSFMNNLALTGTTTNLNRSSSSFSNEIYSSADNAPINAYNNSGSEIGGNAANDNTISYWITYTIATLP